MTDVQPLRGAMTARRSIAALSKDEHAAAFYQRFGFVPLPSNPPRLFLPLETLLHVAMLTGR